jgi:succinoglycan exporter
MSRLRPRSAGQPGYARALVQWIVASPDRYLSLADQGLVAICRFVAIVVFARLLSAEEFGAIALAISIAYLFVGFARATFALPFAAFCSERQQLADHGSKWFAFGLLLVAVATVFLAATAAAIDAIGSPTWLVHSAVYSAVLTPAMLAYELSRRWLFQWERYRSSVRQGLVCTAASAIGFTIVWIFPLPWVAVLGLSATYLVATLIGLHGNWPHARMKLGDIVYVWREVSHFTRWTIVEYIADSLQSYGMNVAVVFFSGPAGASIFAATRNGVAPIYTLTSSLGSEMPRLTRAYTASGNGGLHKALRSVQVYTLLVSIPYLLLAAIFSDELLRLLYGAKYAAYSNELRLWALAALLIVIIRPLDMWLLASLDSRTLFMRKLFGAVATVAAAIPLLPPLGVEGALYAIVIGMAVNLIGLATAVYGSRTNAGLGTSAQGERPISAS